jgi:hypothetical protein
MLCTNLFVLSTIAAEAGLFEIYLVNTIETNQCAVLIESIYT